MAIKSVCDQCGKELEMPGALVFGPPDSANKASKWHICAECWPKLMGFINAKWHRETVSG